MGMFFKPRKSGESLDIYVGKGINGKKFDGYKLVSPGGAKTYTHLNFVREGSEFVSRPRGESVYRAAGQKGESSIKAGNRTGPSRWTTSALRDAKTADRIGCDLRIVLNRRSADLRSQRVSALKTQELTRQMVREASRARTAGLAPKAITALSLWRSAASSAEGLAKAAARANETAIKVSAQSAEAATRAAAAQAELDAKLAAAAAEQASKAAAKAAEEAAKQAAKTAEALGRTAAKAAEAAAKAAVLATEATAKATAAATEAAIRAAAYTAAAAVSAVFGDR